MKMNFNKALISTLAVVAAILATGCSTSEPSLESPTDVIGNSVTTAVSNGSTPQDSETSADTTTETEVTGTVTTEAEFNYDTQFTKIDFEKVNISIDNSEDIVLPVKYSDVFKPLNIDIDVSKQTVGTGGFDYYYSADETAGIGFSNTKNKKITLKECDVKSVVSSTVDNKIVEGTNKLSINGIKLGDNIDKVNNAFGTNFTEEENQFTYYALMSDEENSQDSIYLSYWNGKIIYMAVYVQ